MINLKYSLLFCALVLPTMSIAQTRDFYRPPGGTTLIIIGADFETCQKLNSADIYVRRQVHHWRTGYFSGAFVYGSFGADPKVKNKMNDLDPVQLWSELKLYCKSNPNELYISSVQRTLSAAIFDKKP